MYFFYKNFIYINSINLKSYTKGALNTSTK